MRQTSNHTKKSRIRKSPEIDCVRFNSIVTKRHLDLNKLFKKRFIQQERQIEPKSIGKVIHVVHLGNEKRDSIIMK